MRHTPKLSATALAALVAAAAVASCGTATGPDPTAPSATSPTALSHGGPVHDHVSFVDQLRVRGVSVDIVGAASRPFLRPRGTRLHLAGAGLPGRSEVESYNYDSTDLGTDGARAAKDDAARIARDGSPRTATPQPAGPVHFFLADRVLVVYVGSDPATTKLLTDLLGPQFAGA